MAIIVVLTPHVEVIFPKWMKHQFVQFSLSPHAVHLRIPLLVVYSDHL